MKDFIESHGRQPTQQPPGAEGEAEHDTERKLAEWAAAQWKLGKQQLEDELEEVRGSPL